MFTTKNLIILIIKDTIITSIVIAIGVASIFILNTKINKITDGVANTHRIENELKKRIELISVIDKDAQRIGENHNLINQAFIPSDNIGDFMNALDNLDTKKASTQKYRFESPVDYQNNPDFATSTINYSDNMSMSIDNISGYLKDFESMPYFTKIEGLSISSQSQNGWKDNSTNLSFKATLLTKTSK